MLGYVKGDIKLRLKMSSLLSLSNNRRLKDVGPLLGVCSQLKKLIEKELTIALETK